MNQSTNSLEDKLKARLQEYEAPPPPGAGGAILDQINGGAGNSPWIITLVFLLGILMIGGGFYMTTTQSAVDGQASSSTTIPAAMSATASATASTNVASAASTNASATASTNVINVEQAGLTLISKTELSSNQSTPSNSGQSVDQVDDVEPQRVISENSTNTNETTTNSPEGKRRLPSAVALAEGEKQEVLAQSTRTTAEAGSLASTQMSLTSSEEATEGEDRLTLRQLLPKELDEPGLEWSRKELSIDAYEAHDVVQPSRRKRYHLYGDLGVFFLYNHLQPNKNDGLIMENFETSGSFSLDRLSYYAELGMKRNLSRKVTIRAAAVANLFAQKYSFDIRDEASSSVQVSSMDENLFTPVFERQTVSMDHFLVSAGLRLSTDFKVFKSDLNRLMLGLGYHHILNREHIFEYNGEIQKIEYPHQLTASFGFRKVVWQSERGELSLLPVLRYGLVNKASEISALTIKPFSVGLTIGYGLK